jgi:hypothetical protein
MDTDQIKKTVSEDVQTISFWAKAHGKATAVIIAVVVGLILGFILFHK